jgi:hypothetical protein
MHEAVNTYAGKYWQQKLFKYRCKRNPNKYIGLRSKVAVYHMFFVTFFYNGGTSFAVLRGRILFIMMPDCAFRPLQLATSAGIWNSHDRKSLRENNLQTYLTSWMFPSLLHWLISHRENKVLSCTLTSSNILAYVEESAIPWHWDANLFPKRLWSRQVE